MNTTQSKTNINGVDVIEVVTTYDTPATPDPTVTYYKQSDIDIGLARSQSKLVSVQSSIDSWQSMKDLFNN